MNYRRRRPHGKRKGYDETGYTVSGRLRYRRRFQEIARVERREMREVDYHVAEGKQ